MKKLLLSAWKKVELVEAPIPVPGPGEAVVRIKYAGICGSDLHVFDGMHPTATVPLVMGHEACGELYAINSDRTDLKVGDKVCAHTIKPCRACKACTSGRENLCSSVKIMGTNFDGVFTQYLLVDADRVIRFDDGVSDRIAALVEPLTVAVHDVRRSGLRPGENVLVAGAGPIGIIIAIMARFSGAAHVVLTEIDPARIALAQETFGFTVVDPTGPDLEKVCAAATGGEGFDRIFEITAVRSSFDTCVSQLKVGGVLVQVGMPPKGTSFALNTDKIIYSECEVRGVRHHTMNDMQAAAELINAGVLNEQLAKMVSVIYPMEQSREALERARSDKASLRVLIDFS